jgi:NAD(P)H-flavin reductase/nitrite reductase/ring-hydroxylating ferredoxin subunit
MAANSVPSPWVYACRTGELENGEGLRVQLPGGGKKDAVALFAYAGEFFALEDRCCHADKSIHGGDIEDLEDCVIGKSGEVGNGGVCVQCPRHQRKFAGGLYFNLKTGVACTPENTSKFEKLKRHRIKIHDVRVENGCIYVSKHPVRPKDDSENNGKGRAQKSVGYEVIDLVGDPAEKKARTEPSHFGSWYAKLDRKERINHDTFIFHFRHPANAELPLAPESPVWHATLHAHIDGEAVERDYTPLSNWSEFHDERRLRLLIKIYPDGAMTQHLASLSIDDHVRISLPHITLTLPAFLPPTYCSSMSQKVPVHAVLFAAGTGIMPMLQVLDEIFKKNSHWVTVTLMYSNRTSADVVCLQEILKLARRCTKRSYGLDISFQIWLALSQEDPSQRAWCKDVEELQLVTGILKHRLNANDVSRALGCLSFSRGDVLVLSSGPDGFYESMVEALPLEVRKEAICVNLDA